MAKHARLSASGSKRWMSCPGSVAAESKVPGERKSSIFAMEGTAAHLLCEIYSRENIRPEEFLGETIVIKNGDAYLETKLSQADWAHDEHGVPICDYPTEAEFVVDQDMVDAVEYFVAAVELARAKLDPRGREEFHEEWIDMTWLHPLLGGTGDFICVEAFGFAELIDYKHGRGVLVEVYDNPQLKIYATGILHKFPDCEGVTVTIVQPRKEHDDGPIRSVSYTRQELMDFAEELREAAEATQRPNAPLCAGEHCGFCGAKAYTDENGTLVECEALVQRIQEEAGVDFGDEPPAVGITAPTATRDLARVASWIPAIDGYVKAIEGAIARELMAGRPVPGFKLVRKKANRVFGAYVEEEDELTGEFEGRWVSMSEDDVLAIMESEADLPRDKCFQPGKLKSPAQFEKIGKYVKTLVGEMAYKPEGGLTVAPESDPRPAVDIQSVAAADFPDEPGDD